MSMPLPTGTVTFLFTDVEGSTRLLEELGVEGYAVELGRHREIVRAALADHGGVEVDTQGDAFFCAFASARSAVACAAEIRDALASGPVLLRMGIHTGEALVVDRHYVGMDVHRAARIGACGHGGQVVISPTTTGLLDPAEFALHDLGAHRLKDLSAPLVLHQLGDVAFPPLKTLFRTNLPVPATPFLGREEELAGLVAEASSPGVRVLTLTGPGGTGKTRLSLQLAAELSEEYRDGVWWIPLAPLRDEALVASAVAGVLEVDEEPGRSLVDSVVSALARKRMLLLLDNCEHVVEAAARLASAVGAGSPDTLVVATSREPLAIGGERVFPVQPLAERDAVELFFARAQAVGAHVDRSETAAVVTALCARLDNLPLAVELAAARTPALPPAALLDRLATRLDVLAGPRDAEERQRTLRATIGWSYDLLEEPERQLFRWLAVFVGGASLSAIENVCEADLGEILSIVSKSLARRASVESDEPRYFMLETIREFAAEELAASGALDDMRARHARWFADVARRAPERDSPDSGQRLAILELDLENLRAAFAWTEHERASSSDGIALARALATRHFMRGRYSEADEILRRAIALEPVDPLEAAVLWDRLARVLRLQALPDAALEAFRTAEETLETVTDRDEVWWERWLEVELDLATFFYFGNAQEELAALVEELEPLIERHGTPAQRLDLFHLRGQLAYRRERYAISEKTEALVRETYRMACELGDSTADFTLGFCLLWRGKPAEAWEHFALGLEVARSRGFALVETRCLVYGAVARRRQNDPEGARELVRELEAQEELHGYRGLTAAVAAWIAYRDGDVELASARGREALADWEPDGRGGSGVFAWTARFPLLGAALARTDVESALEHARAMLDASLQPLPDEIAAALERAAASGRPDDLQVALDVARPHGYS